MENDNVYYVYIYLNPLKPGNFVYDDLKFKFEPFYVGKGKGKRMFVHYNEQFLKTDVNKHKVNIIKQILSEGRTPIILKKFNNLTEQESFDIEKKLIELIGRSDIKTGCLVNMTNGGDGCSGHIWQYGRKLSEETKCKISKTIKSQGKWKGENNPSKTKEHKEYMSTKLKGRLVSEDTKNKISKKAKGRKYSETVIRDRSFKRAKLTKSEFLDKSIFIIKNINLETKELSEKTGFSISLINVIKSGKHWVNTMTLNEINIFKNT